MRVTIPALLGTMMVTACASDPAGPSGPILDIHWVVAEDTSGDPYPSHRPLEDSGCVSVSESLESFHVETGWCPYYLGIQPLLASAEPGDELTIEYFHGDLLEPGAGHIALAIGGSLIWEVTIEMPHGGALYSETVTLDRPLTQGEEAVLHLHNHGANSWNIKAVSLTN